MNAHASFFCRDFTCEVVEPSLAHKGLYLFDDLPSVSLLKEKMLSLSKYITVADFLEGASTYDAVSMEGFPRIHYVIPRTQVKKLLSLLPESHRQHFIPLYPGLDSDQKAFLFEAAAIPD